jgi:hypothetical protein
MSVTFSVEGNPTGTFHFSPAEDCVGGLPTTAASYAQALDIRHEHVAQCPECDAWGCYTVADFDTNGTPEVNLANTNARLILDILDIACDDEDLAGSMDAEDFLGRVLVAAAMRDDHEAGVADEVLVPVRPDGTWGATWVDCGTPDNYVPDRLVALEEVALAARSLGRDVTWA